MKIARVFPRITKATPDDNLAFFDAPGLFPPEVDEVHVSVTFTYDIPKAEYLAKCWEPIAPVKIGGPAFGKPSGEFIPGRYLKNGYTITSRGCPNKCWFCSVWKREPKVIELTISDGWLVQDDNLLACSQTHIEKVFEMLRRQKQPIEFSGGLEAKLLKSWHIDLLKTIRFKQIFFAYDTPDDYEPLREAAKALWGSGLTNKGHKFRTYVLIGHPRDTIESAEKRLRQTLELDLMPFAMLWRNEKGETNKEWRKFQRMWARPAIIASAYKRANPVDKTTHTRAAGLWR